MWMPCGVRSAGLRTAGRLKKKYADVPGTSRHVRARQAGPPETKLPRRSSSATRTWCSATPSSRSLPSGRVRGDLRRGRAGDVLALGHRHRRLRQRRLRGRVPALRHGLSLHLLAQRPDDEQRQRNLHRPGGRSRASSRRREASTSRSRSAASRPPGRPAVPPSPTSTGDGRLDLVVNNFNDRAFYFRNDCPRRTGSPSACRAPESNRDAIGAVVRLHLGKES